jgi:hypothetical protein
LKNVIERQHFLKGMETIIRCLPFDDVFQCRGVVDDLVDMLPIIMIDKLAHRPGIVKQILDFTGLPPAIDRTGDPPYLDDSEIGVEKLRGVVHEDTYPIAFPDTQFLKAFGYPGALLVQFPIGDVPFVIAYGDFITVATGLSRHHFPDVRKL